MNNSEEMLACAVIEQAIEDLRFLLKRQIDESVTVRGGIAFTKAEVNAFFQGEWCGLLLALIHSGIKGAEIVKKIEGEFR